MTLVLPIGRVATVSGVKLDWRAWPIVVCAPPPYAISDEALLDSLDFFERIVMQAPERHVVVLDLSQAATMSLTQARMLGKRLESAREALEARCTGAAIVFGSPVLSKLLTAVLWVFKPSYELRVFSARAEADAWAFERAGRPLQATPLTRVA